MVIITKNWWAPTSFILSHAFKIFQETQSQQVYLHTSPLAHFISGCIISVHKKKTVTVRAFVGWRVPAGLVAGGECPSHQQGSLRHVPKEQRAGQTPTFPTWCWGAGRRPGVCSFRSFLLFFFFAPFVIWERDISPREAGVEHPLPMLLWGRELGLSRNFCTFNSVWVFSKCPFCEQARCQGSHGKSHTLTRDLSLQMQ